MTLLAFIGYIYLAFIGIRFFIVLLNFFSQPYLKKHETKNKPGKVSVLIPARNEEKNIGNLLEKLLLQTYPIHEILVYNDQSTDKTEEIVKTLSLKNPVVKMINGIELPANWLGKNHACYQLANTATGDYYLFLDADVHPYSTLIKKAIGRIKEKELKLLSIFPKQIMKSFGEKLVVPLMHNILLSLLPLFYVRMSNRVSFSAANGQFMLFEAQTYNRIQPHQWVKQKIVEDIGITRLYKKFHLKCETLLGNNSIECQMYNGFEEAVSGFIKNIQNFFGNSKPLMIIYTTLCLLGWSGLLFLPPNVMIIGFANLFLYHLLIGITAGRKPGNLLLIPLQTITTFLVAIKSLYALKTNALTWKGRKIKP